MAAEDELCLAPLGNRHDVAVVERVCIRMMHHEDAPLRLLGSRTRQIFLNPLERIIDALTRLSVERHLGVDGIHLEKAPGVAVDQREMCRAIIKREGVATVRRMDGAPLRCREESIVEGAVIVVAVDVISRHARKEFWYLVEPVVLVLVMLITCAEGNIAAMQDEFRGLLRYDLLEERTVVKEMRVRERQQMEMLGRFRQCREGCCRDFTIACNRISVFRRGLQPLDDSRVDTGALRILLTLLFSLISDGPRILRPVSRPCRHLESLRHDGFPSHCDLRSARVQEIGPVDDVLCHILSSSETCHGPRFSCSQKTVHLGTEVISTHQEIILPPS